MSDRLEVTGMVISSVPVGDYDRRLVLLTKERGKISGFAKGARRQNSAMLAPSSPFAFGTFECFEGKTAYNFYSAQITQYFEGLSSDFEAAYMGMYFLEFADYYTRENADETEMLKLLYLTLKVLEKKIIDKRLVRYIFELRAMMINGEYPEMFACVNCGSTEDLAGYLHDRNGVLCKNCIRECMGWRLKDSTIYALQYILSSPVEKLYRFSVTEDVYQEIAAVLDKFRSKVIDRRFKSLEILESLTF